MVTAKDGTPYGRTVRVALSEDEFYDIRILASTHRQSPSRYIAEVLRGHIANSKEPNNVRT